MKKVLMLIMVMTLIVVFFTGCQTDSIVNENDTSDSDQGSSLTDQSETSASTPKVAFILKTLANEYWAGINEGILARAEEVGMEAVVFAVNSESDTQGQLQKFEDVLSQDFDVIAFSPISPANLNSAIVLANEAGIPVIDIDDLADIDDLESQGGYIDTFVSADNILMGTLGAEALVEAMGDEGGEVAIIEGISGVMGSELRKEGATAVFAEYPNIEVVEVQPADWDRAKALDVTTNILQRHPDLKAIYCANDTMAMGAYEAIVNAGKEGSVYIAGTDGNPETIESINNGEVTATVLQDTAITGAACVDAAMDLFKNGGSTDGEMKIDYVDLIKITKANAAEYLK